MKKSLLLFIAVELIVSGFSSPLIVKKPSDNSKSTNGTLKDEPGGVTEEERKFLKEIEAKFNIKNEEEDEVKQEVQKIPQTPFPAVIAIEIVNDTATDGKGKRTIDANLGYGYKTDSGYVYNRFDGGKGKFMIYPYSQHDIPAHTSSKKFPYRYYTQSFKKPKGEKTIVEIQPSRAYQLVPINQNEPEGNTYKLDGAVSQFRTKYEHIQSVQTPPPPQYAHSEYSQHSNIPMTLYTTLNGGQLSGLSGHFPIVMPNYYVNPSQFFSHPQFQGFSLGREQSVPQKPIIPVIILRIPSSQIQSPTAELFPKLSHDSPYSSILNNIDLQSIVSQYLTNLQPQYDPVPTLNPSYVYQNQPVMYYDPQQTVYTVPKVKYAHTAVPEIKYAHTAVPSYVNPSQYITHTAPEDHQTIKYVIPHSSPMPDGHQPMSHMTLSQVYGGPQETREHTEEDNLPFSENYPDPDHTQVIYTPQYQSPIPTIGHTPLDQTVTYVTQPSTHKSKTQAILPTMPENQVETAQEDHAPAPDKLTPQGPYNYHAHPYLKRQINSSTPKPDVKKNGHHSRKLMMGIHTSA